MHALPVLFSCAGKTSSGWIAAAQWSHAMLFASDSLASIAAIKSSCSCVFCFRFAAAARFVVGFLRSLIIYFASSLSSIARWCAAKSRCAFTRSNDLEIVPQLHPITHSANPFSCGFELRCFFSSRNCAPVICLFSLSLLAYFAAVAALMCASPAS